MTEPDREDPPSREPGGAGQALGIALAVTAADITAAAAAVFRPDNRIVLTYIPDLPPADSAALDGDAQTESEEVAA